VGKDAFSSPIARSIFVSVPLGSILPPERAVFALTDFSMGDHATFDEATARLDHWVLNSGDVPAEVAGRYDAASLEMVRALDTYLATRLDDSGNIVPHTAELKALQDANDAFVRSCTELAVVWGPGADWNDWNDRSPDAVKAVSFAQAVSSEYVRAGGVEFEVRERGLSNETDALEVLGEISANPAGAGELAEYYTWLSSDEGKRVAESLERGGAYGGVSWGRGGPFTSGGSAPGGSGEVGGPGSSEPGGEPGGEPVGEPGLEPGLEPGWEFERGGEPGR
jgi:hypothetical protein